MVLHGFALPYMFAQLANHGKWRGLPVRRVGRYAAAQPMKIIRKNQSSCE